METTRVNQKFLGNRGFIAFIGFLSAFVPMSTDLYLPALPSMINDFHTNIQTLNLTITFFFLFYAISMLFWGPLSDKHGRRTILTTGMIIYTIGSVLCFIAPNVSILIVSRIFQAIGSGSAMAISTAMMKDLYTGKKLLSMLAAVQSIAMTTPVIAPTIGSLILKYTSWHGIFFVLTVVGFIAVIGSFLLTETINAPSKGSMLKVFGNLFVVSKNPRFSLLMLVFSIPSLPMMAYITMSSYIYMDNFHLSDQVYSIFYACTGLALVLGPMFYIRIAKRFKEVKIVIISFAIVVLSGICLQAFGFLDKYTFLLCMIPAMFFGNMLRPPGTNIMLMQQDDNIGAASSLISFASTIMGSLGMFLVTLDFGNKVKTIGFMYMIVGVISLVTWIILTKTHFIKIKEH